MTRDEANRLTLRIGESFPGIGPTRATEIRESIEELDADVVSRLVSEQVQTCKFFDLPRLLSRARTARPALNATGQQIREELRQREQARRQEREQAAQSFADVLALDDEELDRLAADALDRLADSIVVQAIRRRRPRESPTLLALIQQLIRDRDCVRSGR